VTLVATVHEHFVTSSHASYVSFTSCPHRICARVIANVFFHPEDLHEMVDAGAR
jgi:hypothetical protein